MIVLDTHALLWWALEPERLSGTAAAVCAEMERDGTGIVSSISFWELAVKVARKKLELPLEVGELVARIEATGAVEIVAVDTAIWLDSVALPWAHRDPADRMIVATARRRGARVLSKDDLMHAEEPSLCVW